MSWSPAGVLALAALEAAGATANWTRGVVTVRCRSDCQSRYARRLDRRTGAPTGGRQEIPAAPASWCAAIGKIHKTGEMISGRIRATGVAGPPFETIKGTQDGPP